MTPADPILDRLSRLHPKAMDLSLGRLQRLLTRLDHPERRLPPVVHIAGTNGKGSTLAMLAAMLEAAGVSAHRYVSPHLVRFNERILLGGRPIRDADLEAFLLEVESANGNAPITFFEVTTAAALLAFTRTPADVVLLETGLGGRLDATNVIPEPRLTLLSSISFDHEAYLGRTLTAIAREKCGILRRGVPALSAPQRPPVDVAVRQACARLGAPLSLAPRDWQVTPGANGFSYVDADGALDLPQPALPGAHQLENAGLAIAAARRLGPLAPSSPAIAAGLRATRWPARLQRLNNGRLVDLIRPGDELWIDGSHNPDGGRVSAAYFGTLPPMPFHAVVGMLNTKDATHYLEPLVPVIDRLVAVPVPGTTAGFDPERLAETARRLGIEATTAADVEAGLALVRQGPAARIAVLGSLYLAGAALARNAQPQR